MAMAKKKKPTLTRSFKKAKVNFPWSAPQRFRRVKAGEYSLLADASPSDIRALDEIRVALIMCGGPRVGILDFTRVRGGNPDWTEEQVAHWHRFKAWHAVMTKEDRLARDACILYSSGNSLREIDRDLRMRKGMAKQKVKAGWQEYTAIVRKHEKEPPATKGDLCVR
jgi:hypothetical protein